jgi:hypothetical protein
MTFSIVVAGFSSLIGHASRKVGALVSRSTLDTIMGLKRLGNLVRTRM